MYDAIFVWAYYKFMKVGPIWEEIKMEHLWKKNRWWSLPPDKETLAWALSEINLQLVIDAKGAMN